MVHNIKLLLKKKFIRNVIVLASGTLAAQLISMSLIPFITRLYGPEAYGVMGLFIAITSILTPIAALTYPIAIILPKEKHEAKRIVKLSAIITIVISSFMIVFIIFFKDYIIKIFNVKEIEPFIYLIPLVIFFSGIMQITEQWLIRTRQFTTTAKVSVFHAIITQGGKVLIGYFYAVTMVLIYITAFGNALKALMMMKFSKDSIFAEREKNTQQYEKLNLKEVAHKYIDFPVYRAPEVFLNSISQNLPVLMLTSFFGPAATGFYTLGRTVLNLPANLLGKSIGDVFYPRISEAKNNGEKLTPLISKATRLLVVVGILPFGIIIAFGPSIFSFVFGEEWITGGEYARWIALWTFFGFINKPSVKSLPVLSAQSFQLKFTILTLVVRILAIVIGYYIFTSDTIAIMLFCIFGAVMNFYLVIKTLKLSRLFDSIAR